MEMTLNAKRKKKRSKKEEMIEICRWKLKFHEEKAEELKAQFQDQLEDTYDSPTFWLDNISMALDRVD